MDTLLRLFFLLKLVHSFQDIYLNNQTYKGWHHYKYFENTSTQPKEILRTYILTEMKPRAFLMCPKNYGILKISSSYFKVKENSWSSVQVYDEFNEGHCVSLVKCLHFQACVFDFGNEFCGHDPEPGHRKSIMVNVTCAPDGHWKQDFVAHLTYRVPHKNLSVFSTFENDILKKEF